MTRPARPWGHSKQPSSERSPRPATVQTFALLHLVRDFSTIVPLLAEFTDDENPLIVWLTNDDFAIVSSEDDETVKRRPKEQQVGVGMLLTLTRETTHDTVELRTVVFDDDSSSRQGN